MLDVSGGSLAPPVFLTFFLMEMDSRVGLPYLVGESEGLSFPCLFPGATNFIK